jgi:hypothetical protein
LSTIEFPHTKQLFLGEESSIPCSTFEEIWIMKEKDQDKMHVHESEVTKPMFDIYVV